MLPQIGIVAIYMYKRKDIKKTHKALALWVYKM